MTTPACADGAPNAARKAAPTTTFEACIAAITAVLIAADSLEQLDPAFDRWSFAARVAAAITGRPIAIVPTPITAEIIDEIGELETA